MTPAITSLLFVLKLITVGGGKQKPKKKKNLLMVLRFFRTDLRMEFISCRLLCGNSVCVSTAAGSQRTAWRPLLSRLISARKEVGDVHSGAETRHILNNPESRKVKLKQRRPGDLEH